MEYEDNELCMECSKYCGNSRDGLCQDCREVHESEDMEQMMAIENQIGFKGGVFVY